MPVMFALSLFACDMGPSADSVVDELRVLAALADPPEAAPGEQVTLDTLIVDPEDLGYEVLTWSCTFTGESCLEAAGDTVWDGSALTQDPPASWISSTVRVSQALNYAATEQPAPFLQTWTLACEPGLCPVMDLYASATDGSSEAEAVRELLADPTALLEGMPLTGVSLGLRAINVSTRGEDDRVKNPTIDCTVRSGFSREVSVEGVVPFECEVSGEFNEVAAVWGYTTDGGWGGASVDLSPGDTSLTYDWFAPEEPADVSAWLIVTDGEGGVGIFETTIEVQ